MGLKQMPAQVIVSPEATSITAIPGSSMAIEGSSFVATTPSKIILPTSAISSSSSETTFIDLGVKQIGTNVEAGVVIPQATMTTTQPIIATSSELVYNPYDQIATNDQVVFRRLSDSAHRLL